MWYHIQARAGNIGEISIFDAIGKDGVTAEQFATELAALGPVQKIQLRINSPGGEVFAGFGIYNILSRHKSRKIVIIDGVAASMASVIAMVGDPIIMPENAMMMVHEASNSLPHSTAEQMRIEAAAIDRMNASMAGIYAAKTGLSTQKIADMMKAETWLTAKEALELGFADQIEQPVRLAALFNIDQTFASTPQALRDAASWDRAVAKHNTQFYGGALR